MQRLKDTHEKSNDLDNCFGFNESDFDFSVWEKSSVMNETNAPIEFQSDKPYRLALYVRPTEHKRLQRTRALLAKSTIEKQQKNKKNETLNSTQLNGKKETRRNGRANKNLSVSLFDENVKPENMTKKAKKTPEKIKPEKNVTIEVPSSTKKNVLREVNTKSLTRTKQIKVRRSYERKFKEKDESENVPEPPSEEIIRDLEFKKISQISRTKQKKTAKEEQEYEKWANNMNSAFDDVDKFELSIAYD